MTAAGRSRRWRGMHVAGARPPSLALQNRSEQRARPCCCSKGIPFQELFTLLTGFPEQATLDPTDPAYRLYLLLTARRPLPGALIGGSIRLVRRLIPVLFAASFRPHHASSAALLPLPGKTHAGVCSPMIPCRPTLFFPHARSFSDPLSAAGLSTSKARCAIQASYAWNWPSLWT